MVFQERRQCPISINLINSELADALPGRRNVSVCRALKRCKAEGSPARAEVNACGQGRDNELPRPPWFRVCETAADARSCHMIKDGRLLSETWEERPTELDGH